MINQDCPLCMNPVSPCDNNDNECVCEVCAARFFIEFDADCVDGEYVDCSNVGSRICDPDPRTEYVFRLREAKPGTHVESEGVTYIRIQDDDPYLHHAWLNTETGRTFHYSYLIECGVFTSDTYARLKENAAVFEFAYKKQVLKYKKPTDEEIAAYQEKYKIPPFYRPSPGET